jgi:hypothetical protein
MHLREYVSSLPVTLTANSRCRDLRNGFRLSAIDLATKLSIWPVGPWGPTPVVGIATKPLGGLMIVFVTLVLPVTA